jgi:hypothetical protein
MSRTLVATILGLALAGALACGRKDPEPVKAAKAYASAMQRSDVKALIELLDRDAADRLQAAAARASDHVGGRRIIEPHEMLQIVDIPTSFQVAEAELVSGGDDSAQVKLVAADGTEHFIDLVMQDGRWRVRVNGPGQRAEPVAGSDAT